MPKRLSNEEQPPRNLVQNTKNNDLTLMQPKLTQLRLGIVKNNAQDCNTVFRGAPTFQNCQYRCHCKEDTQCNTTTGECENGCDFGWMGPGCQYRNVAKFNAVVYNMGQTLIPSDFSILAVDGNVTTCSRSNGYAPNGHHYWRIQWDKEYRIVGLVLKIQPSDVDDFNSFRVEAGYGPNDGHFTSICYQHGDIPGRPVMEIMCHETVWTKNIRIILNKRNTRIRLCEVEIYGGRVVSFNKPTNQSSTYANSTSSLAVDGQPQVPGQIAETTCSTTAGLENNPHWLVNFLGEYAVQSVYFYGRRELYPSQYSGFRMSLINDGSNGQSIYEDSGNGTVDQYQPKIVNLTSPIAAHYLQINRPVDNVVLTICEIEVFAECPPHKCGLDCLSDCYCEHETTGSYRQNGICPYGCYGRWTGLDNKCNMECNATSWGNQCQNTCGDCLDSPCDAETGYCTHKCRGSYEPPLCVKGCLNGTYGLDCTGICGNCSGGWLSCDQTTGACIHGCSAGYKGEQCKQNRVFSNLRGFSVYLGNALTIGQTLVYTDNSTEQSGGLFEFSLHNISSRFVTVKRVGMLTLCNVSLIEADCPTGHFGFYCQEMCHCADNRPCDKQTGVCQTSVCKIGWTGVSCNNGCPFQTFGEKCKLTCFCKNGTCSKDYGICASGCQTGYKGFHCNEDCPDGSFGDECSQVCHCNGTTCTKDKGICPTGCRAGYGGQHCNEESDSGVAESSPDYTNAIIIGTCLGAVVIVANIVVFIFWSRIKARFQSCYTPLPSQNAPNQIAP